jgi:hypothetical protein
MKAVLALCILTLVAFSCKKSDVSTEDLLISTWTLTDKTIDNIPVTLTDCEKQMTMEFQVNNFCLVYNACSKETINSGWIYKYEMLNISECLPAAFYIQQLDNASLKLMRKDISSEGNLQVTVLSYIKIP